MRAGVPVGDRRDDGDVGLGNGTRTRDVVELAPHDRAIADGALQHAVGSPDAGGMERVLGLADDDDALEQLDAVICSQDTFVDQAEVFVGSVPREAPRRTGLDPSHARRLHLALVIRNTRPRNTRELLDDVASEGRGRQPAGAAAISFGSRAAVPYDFHRLMEYATLRSCAGFGKAIVANR
jgi:hypothetical protein